MATLGTLFAGSAYALGGEKKAKQEGPPINAQSTEEEKFIQYVAGVHRLCGLMLTPAIQGLYKECECGGAKSQTLVGRLYWASLLQWHGKEPV